MRENETLSEQNNGELKGEYPDSQVIEKRMKIKSGILRCAQKQNSKSQPKKLVGAFVSTDRKR